MNETVIFEQANHVARLTLNNPERHNSLGKQELVAISAALDSVESNPDVRALVVTGAGDKTFCAGASLPELNAGKIRGEDYQDVTNQLAALQIPTVCALNGNVFGGGVEMALSCDFRIGIEGSRMRVPAAAIGLCYPIQGIERFVQRLGVSGAKRILMAAEALSADEMLRIGFLDHLVMPAQFDEVVRSYAENLATLAPLSVMAMKTIIHAAASGSLDLDEAQSLAAQCQESADLQEGFTAQKEKRPPRFVGR